MPANIASRLHTDTPLLKDLISDIRKGVIKIPQFQRRFVWKEAQAYDLLDSVANNYPVGSLLLWRTNLKLAAERNIGDFTLPETDDLSPTDYVLDGQQRLTVVYSCLGAAPEGPGFAAAYDLIDEAFIQQPATQQVHVFPLRLIFDTTKMLNFRTALVSHPRGAELQSRMDRLLEVIGNYRIPVVVLKELTVEEVCPIFERINSSGTRLSTYDLMVAATWSKDFNLDDEATRISDTLTSKGFGDISGDTILKCLAAIKYSSIKRDRVLSLRTLSHAEMDSLVDTTGEALLRAVDLLVTEFKLYSWDFLPYEAIIVILACIFARRKSLSKSEVPRVRQWFWTASFSERYRGAADTFITRDLEVLDAFIANSNAEPVGFGDPLSASQLLTTAFRNDNSRSRALVLALASKAPRNLTNGVLVDTTEALSIYNKKQFHHVFPLDFLRRTKTSGEHNCLANICMLAASENRAISNEDPRVYMPQLIAAHGDQADPILSSNLLPLAVEIDYSKADYRHFLSARAPLLEAYIGKLCSGDI